MQIENRHGQLPYYVATVVAIGVFAYFLQAVPLPPEVFTLGLLIVAVTLVPLFSWIRSGSRSVPMFALICLSYGLQYGFSVFSQPNSLVIQNVLTDIPWESLRKAQLLALIGIVAMVAGYYVLQTVLRNASVPVVDLPLDRNQRGVLLLCCVVFWVVGRFLQSHVGGTLGGVLKLLSSLPLLGLAAFAIAVFRDQGQSARWERTAVWVLLLWLCTLGFGSGMLENMFVPVVVVLILKVAKSRRISVVLMLVGFVLLSVLNGIKSDVRAGIKDAPDTSALGFGSIRLWTDAVQRADYTLLWRDKPEENRPAYWRVLLDRFGLLNRFGWVCMNTPERVPYFLGETYKYFLYAPVPRFAWPDKPIASESTAVLDYAYMLRDTTEGFSYVIGIGYIPEAYANFSWIGVATILVLQGLAFALIDKFLNGERSHGGAAIFILITVSFINGIGATSIMLFGNMLQIAGCCIVLLYLISGRLRAGSEGGAWNFATWLRHPLGRPFARSPRPLTR